MYVLPGMGEDAGMYSQAWHNIPDSKFIDWNGCEAEESLGSVAQRLCDKWSIQNGSIVVGTSLGGMVACEISKIVDLERLVLISSAKNKNEVSSLLSLIHPLIDLAPIKFIQNVVGKYPSDLGRMFSQSNAKFIRAMCKAIFDWDGLDESGISPIRIHGRNDKVIPLPGDTDLIVDGGHLISITHAADCIEFLKAQTNR